MKVIMHNGTIKVLLIVLVPTDVMESAASEVVLLSIFRKNINVWAKESIRQRELHLQQAFMLIVSPLYGTLDTKRSCQG